MVLIAIAGGSSPALGRAIVTSIQKPSNTPIILARRKISSTAATHGALVRHVDYDDHASLVAALQGVHTVISVLYSPGPAIVSAQLILLRAAKEAGVKRFAPSEYELGPEADGRVELFKPKLEVWRACVESGLEVARFNAGMFMNYLAIGWDFGGDKGREEEVLAGLSDHPMIWDMGACKAIEPVKEDGTRPMVTLTLLEDVGQFVAAACELPEGEWRHDMSMAGDTLRVDEVTRLIRDVTGKAFTVDTVDYTELSRRVEAIEGVGKTYEEIIGKMEDQIELVMLDEEVGCAILKPVLNTLCPGVRPTSVKEYLGRLVR